MATVYPDQAGPPKPELTDPSTLQSIQDPCPSPGKSRIFGQNIRPRQYAAMLGVGGLHVLALLILLGPKSPQVPPAELEIPISTTLFFPRLDEIAGSAPRDSRPLLLRPLKLSAPPAPEIQTPESPISEAASPIDWMGEAHRTAADLVDAEAAAHGAPAAAAPNSQGTAASTHYAGEQYTLPTGETLIWLSDRCYMVSDPPDPSSPNALVHLAQSRTTCRKSEARGDLFQRKKHQENPE